MNLYRRGYRAELKLMKLLKQGKEFHTVLRSAGSRSSFDVIAIGVSRILLCQVKAAKGKFKREREKLRPLKVPGCVRKQLKVYQKGRWTTIRIK